MSNSLVICTVILLTISMIQDSFQDHSLRSPDSRHHLQGLQRHLGSHDEFDDVIPNDYDANVTVLSSTVGVQLGNVFRNYRNVTISTGAGTAIQIEAILLLDGLGARTFMCNWEKNGVPLFHFNNAILATNDCKAAHETKHECVFAVNLTQISIFDSGKYEYILKSGSKEIDSKSIHIQIFETPYLILSEYHKESTASAEINFTCSISNFQNVNPRITYSFRWYISGVKLSDSDIRIQNISRWQQLLTTRLGNVSRKDVSCNVGSETLWKNVSVKLGSTKSCKAEHINGTYWSETSAGVNAKEPCSIGYYGRLSRMCQTNGVWTKVQGSCISWTIRNIDTFLVTKANKQRVLDFKTYLYIVRLIKETLPRFQNDVIDIGKETSVVKHLLDKLFSSLKAVVSGNRIEAFFTILDEYVGLSWQIFMLNGQSDVSDFYDALTVDMYVADTIYNLNKSASNAGYQIYKGTYIDAFLSNKTQRCTNDRVGIRLPVGQHEEPILQGQFSGCRYSTTVIKYKITRNNGFPENVKLRNRKILSDIISVREFPYFTLNEMISVYFYHIQTQPSERASCVDLFRDVSNSFSKHCTTTRISTETIKCDCSAGTASVAILSPISIELPKVENITDTTSLLNALDTVEKTEVGGVINVVDTSSVVKEKVDFVAQISVLNISYESEEAAANVTKKFTSLVNDLVANTLDLSKQDAIHERESTKTASTILSSVDKFGANVLQSLKMNQSVTITKPNIVMEIKKIKPKTVTFPESSTTKEDDETKFTLSKETLENLFQNDVDAVGFTAVKYSSLGEALKSSGKENHENTDKLVNSPILSLTLQTAKTELNPPLKLKFQHKKSKFSDPVCSFWDFDTSVWSSEGCEVILNTDNFTTCSCNHLTNFAILMSPSDTSEVYEKSLDIITKVGCSISIGCTALTLVVYAIFWRFARKSRQAILLVNMTAAMLLAYLLFLLGTDHTENMIACRVLAVLLHYIFLAFFCLMFVMGVDLVVATVRVFNTGPKNLRLLLLGWGLPAIVVGITLGATQLQGYGNEKFCWLSGLALYAFIAPVLVVITVNIIFIIIVMRIMHATQFKAAQSVKKKLTTAVKNMCVLIPITGLTWIFGVLSITEDLVAFQYIFALLNSLQGLFVFIMHCILNRNIQEGFRQYQRRVRLRGKGVINTSTSKSNSETHSTNVHVTGTTQLPQSGITEKL